MDKQKDSKFKKVILLLSILAVILAILVVLMLIILDPNVSAITFKSSFDDFQGIMVVAIVLITLFIVSKNTILGSEDTTRILQSLLTKLREQEAQSITMKIPDSEPKQPVEKQLINNISESKKNAERLFSRSGNCLLVGCVISILGVFVFYLLNMQTSQEATDLTSRLLQILPRFGVLFFILSNT